MYHKCQVGNADVPGKKRDISQGGSLSHLCGMTGQKRLTRGVPSLSLPHLIKGVLMLSPGVLLPDSPPPHSREGPHVIRPALWLFGYRIGENRGKQLENL